MSMMQFCGFPVCILIELYIHSELQTIHILKGAAMADEIKAEYKRLQEKKRPKKDDALEVDEFEWIQVKSKFHSFWFCSFLV